MRRLIPAVSIVFIAASLMLSTGQFSARTAQTAAILSGQGAGVVDSLLGAGPLAALPGQEMMLRRLTIQPGGGLPAHTHPGSLVVFTESGSWAYTPVAGSAWLSQAGIIDIPSSVPAPLIANSALDYGVITDAPSLGEALTHGNSVVLSAGDVLVVEDTEAAFVNAGEEPVVLLIAGVTRIGEPFTTIMAELETATPEP